MGNINFNEFEYYPLSNSLRFSLWSDSSINRIRKRLTFVYINVYKLVPSIGLNPWYIRIL